MPGDRERRLARLPSERAAAPRSEVNTLLSTVDTAGADQPLVGVGAVEVPG
jgi:hypothetical protein